MIEKISTEVDNGYAITVFIIACHIGASQTGSLPAQMALPKKKKAAVKML